MNTIIYLCVVLAVCVCGKECPWDPCPTSPATVVDTTEVKTVTVAVVTTTTYSPPTTTFVIKVDTGVSLSVIIGPVLSAFLVLIGLGFAYYWIRVRHAPLPCLKYHVSPPNSIRSSLSEDEVFSMDSYRRVNAIVVSNQDERHQSIV